VASVITCRVMTGRSSLSRLRVSNARRTLRTPVQIVAV
jgi:hypothetical protein